MTPAASQLDQLEHRRRRQATELWEGGQRGLQDLRLSLWAVLLLTLQKKVLQAVTVSLKHQAFAGQRLLRLRGLAEQPHQVSAASCLQTGR